MRRIRWLAALGVAFGCLSIVPSVAAQPSPGALPPVLSLRLDFTSMPSLPRDAVGVAVNITATNPVAAGFVTVFPCSDGRPVASNLNFVARQTVPNLVVTALDEFGAFCVETIATTDVIVDLVGYVPFGSPLIMLPAPVRFADTRESGNRAGVRLRAGEIRAVPVAGTPGVPADAAAVVFNATAVDPDRSGFLSVFPCGRPLPSTSTLNFTRGSIVPNLVTTAVGAAGAVCFSAIADLDVVADVSAYVPAGSSGVTLLAAPERIFDTRAGLGGPLAVLGFEPRPVQVTGRAGVPNGATGAIVNLTATESSASGYIAAFPCGGVPPLVSNLNFGVGQNVANAAIVKLSADGSFCLRSNSPAHAVVDIAGYLTSPAAFVPLDPTRVFDSREKAQPLCNLGIVVIAAGYQWLDLATGEMGAVFQTPPPFQGTSFYDISPLCSSAVIVANGMLHEIDLSGRTIRIVPMPVGVFSNRAFMSYDGPLAIGFSVAGTRSVAALVDLVTQRVLLEFGALDRQLGWEFAGAARDLSVFMFFTWLADRTKEFHVLDGNGFEIATFRLPAGSDGFAVSPGGTYMSYVMRFDSGAPDAGRQKILTYAGDPVDVHPAGGVQDPNWGIGWWTSDGTGVSCTRARPNSPELVTVFADIFAALRVTTMPCVRVAL